MRGPCCVLHGRVTDTSLDTQTGQSAQCPASWVRLHSLALVLSEPLGKKPLLFQTNILCKIIIPIVMF